MAPFYTKQNTHKMLRQFSCLWILLLITVTSSFAQKKYTIEGTVIDTEKIPLIGATVVLLTTSDSSFANYGLTTDAGTFSLDVPRDSQYILQVTYMGFNAYVQQITADKDYQLGTITLEEATNLLDAVQVEADHIPIQMKGDTLEFNSAAFNVQTHDDVEALLDQMPGVEIDEEGNVKINGKKVEKILVDGKEFFGEDVKAALKSLPADAIKKVEVFDKKTDQEALTNSKSESDTKTLNLTLKEDKKTGYMGTITGGYGYPNHRYQGNLNLSYFNAKMRISLLGAINNINKAGFSFRDYQSMTGGYGNFMDSHPAMSIGQSWNDPIANLIWGNANGETRAIAGGFNLNFFPSDKMDVSLSYMYTNANKTIEQLSNVRSVTPENFYTRNSASNQINLAQRHLINSKGEYKIDTTQLIRYRFRAKITDANNGETQSAETLGATDSLENSVYQKTQADDFGLGLIGNVYYQKKFNNKGRSISANIAAAYVNNKDVFDNYSTTTIYDTGVVQDIDTLNQLQQSYIGKQVYGAELFYNEPIGEHNRLEFKLIGGLSTETNERQAFDWITNNPIVNPNLTDMYQKYYNFQTFTCSFNRTIEKKYEFSIMGGLRRSELRGVLASNENVIGQSYYYPVGSLNASYSLSESKRINFRYNTRVNEPELDQLQPMLNNQNPLSLALGNPNLIPEYTHSISIGYDNWDQASFSSIYAYIYGSITQNAIVYARSIDETFRTISKPVNAGNSYDGGAYAYYNTEIKKLLKIRLNGGINWRYTPVFINEEQLSVLTHNYNLGLRIGNKKTKVIDASIQARVFLNNTYYSENSSLNGINLNHNYTAKFRATIAKRWTVKTQFTYSVYDNLGYDEAWAVPLWSAGLSCTLLKGDALKIELTAENLLNEAYRVNRYNWQGRISETRTNMLGRYILLAMTYKINKMGGGKPQGGDDDYIIIY